MTLSAGTRLGAYEIRSPLGAGGMGEVYRARDKKLDRDVAIKVLPQSVAADPDTLARFEREAKAVAALSHPNILAIHDFGDQDGIAYAVMELLEGETLRGRLNAGPITQKQAVDYALQVAKGLSAAHEKGIVHRDLKPENLFVTRDGHLKILDFGLAKRVETVAPGKETSAPTGSGHTEPGTVMGTAGYMSPEQVKGLPVDHRSDIFSFGTILYELLSGQRAFKGATSAETMAAILRDEPPDVSESGRNISPALDRIVKHCLEKNRDHRFQSARDITFNLSEQFSPAPTGGPREAAPPVSSAGFWVAVLPFKYDGSNADLAALADGLSEEIVTGLSRFRYLSVVSSASAARMKGEAGDERALGAKLGARYVLEGSIRIGGSAVRVSAQLVDTQTGAQLWSESYGRDLQTSSAFAVQDDVAARIVATVADSYGVLVRSIRSAVRQKDDVHLTPLEWQFQYFAYREQITPSAYAELKSRLERAVERDGRQSDLWACLAQIFVDEYAFGFGTDPAALDRALAAARRGVELDRANQFALVALAQTHFFRQDLAAFGPAAERAMALNPLNTDAVGILGLQIVHTGEFERGTAIVRRAMELNANHAGWMHFAPLWEHFHKGEYEQALERANRVDVPGLFWPFLVVASACGHLGRRAEAESAVRDLLALDPEFAAHARSNIGSWHFASGLMEPLLEGLRKAGLSIPATDGSSDPPRRNGTVTAKAAARADSDTASGQIRADEGFWVAVLPFKYSGADASLTALAEGLTEEIVTGLSRFSYLRVISRGSAADAQSAGKELSARYVMEGSLRQAGAKLRLAVQLVDATTGAHLWAENYERTFAPEAVFELQDDLVPRIVSTVADQYGALVHSMSESLRGRSAGEYSAHEAVLRAFGYWERMTPEEHAEVRDILEAAVAVAPDHSDCLAELALIYWHEYAFGYNLRPDPVGRARAAAQRAVASAPTSHFAHCALATALFFQKDHLAFRAAAERALALNRMDSSTAAILGNMIAYAGDWEYGLSIVERAMQLNPHHAGWYHYVAFCDAYRRRDYPGALASALKVNMPAYRWPHVYLAAVYGQLGEQQRARAALRELHALVPNFGATAREEFGKWLDSELTEHLLDGLRKAGLEISPEKGTAGPVPDLARSSAADSGAARADEGFWVAVLPFKYSGANAELAALAEGITEDIVTGLSRFSYLRVIARSSTSRYAIESVDVRSAGKELGARYVMEGNLRQAGAKLRLAVQLVDAVSGAHLWAENYERTFSSEAVFEVQDDLVPRIVSTVADWYGVLPHTMSEAVRGKAADQLSPYEAVLRGFGYYRRVAPEEHAAVRASLESAVQRAPQHADAWVMLSMMYGEEHRFRFNVKPDPLGRALQAARRAVDLAPSNHLAHLALAQALFFRKDLPAFRSAAERAITLNPMDGSTGAYIGHLMAFAGDWERGCDVFDRARKLNPNHPEWYWALPFYDAYRQGDDRRALTFAPKFANSRNTLTHAMHAALYGQLGEIEAARQALQELLLLAPDYALSARDELGKWYEPDLVERMIEGLRKAGLEISPEKGTAAPAPDLARSSAADSGAARAEEGFWVAVLPFKDGGADPSLTALAEGLTGEIVTGLSRFSYLRVIARSSTSRYANEAVDVRSAGKELGARYVMEGNLRQVGAKLRLAVQLVDAVSGAHLWAENYERAFSPEAVFELQDDLVPRIVSTCADRFGVLARSISDAVRSREPGQLGPYEALMRGFGYHHRLTPVEHAEAREALERAVDRAPSNADCWAMLSWIYSHEHAHGFNVRPGSLERALAAARRAVDIAPSNQLAQQALAVVLFFRKETAGCRSAAERAIALNPLDTSNEAIFLVMFTGDWDRGCALIRWAMELNPHHPRWYGTVLGINEYRLANYRAAVDEVVKANAPDVFWTNMLLAAAHAQLGEVTAARNSLRDLLAQKEDFAQLARELLGKWFDPQLVGHLIDGLRKAGLDAPLEKSAASPARQSSGVSAPVSGAVREDEGFWVAVLPFKYGGNVAELAALAEGLTEDIVTGLSRFSYLRVITRSSTSGAAAEAADVRAAGKALGARYVMEGSVRQAGTKLRLAVQVVDATTGAHLWAENYERTFTPEAVFELQDALVPRIVSTVADSNGVLARSMSEAVRSRDPEQLTPYEAVLRSFGYGQRVTPEELAAARFALELAVQKAPAYADAWAMLAWLHVQDYAQGFNLQADSLTSGATAARRAVEAAPSNSLAYFSLAPALFFQREFQSFRNAADRAVALNPMDGNSIAFLGELLTYAGDRERGLELAGRAKQLNPNYPGWYWYADFYNAYRQGDYRGAIRVALKVNLPGQWFSHAAMAAAYGQLGERDAATKALKDLLKLRPDFAATVRGDIEKWWEPEYVERMIDGWRKAGLEIAGEKTTTPPEPDAVSSTAGSGAVRADEGFWVAVLPFKYGGANADLTALAEGLSEDIVTGLSRFSYLRVIAQSSTARYAHETSDVRSAGKELGARYVMEGTLRQAGAKLRLAVQLVDAVSGAHLWAENYERTFSSEGVFALQDDLVPRIVSTVADTYGVLPHSISEMLRKKGPDQLSPYEAVLRSFGYYERITPEEHAKVRDVLERAVDNAPEQADCWAMLAMMYKDEHTHGFNVRPDPLGRALAAAHRAVEAAPSNHLAHHALASALFFRRELVAFRNAAERTIALNAMDGGTTAFVGHLMAYAGDWERGCALVEHARQLNPNHPGWYWFPAFFDAYRKRDYRGALEVALKINMPGYFYVSAVIAAAYGQLGEGEAARPALLQLLARKPDFAASAREELGKWFGPGEVLEHFLDGLRKAGLDVPALGDPDDQDSRSSKAEAVAIAVLPFADMSAAKDQEYLCEGMAEEIMNALVRVDGIRVASRTSTFQARRQGADLPAIGKLLSVGQVLEGSVRTAGDRLRVTAQLTDVASGFQLWSERFDRKAEDVFAVQDEIAMGVVEAVKARLAPGAAAIPARPRPTNLEAYRSYLKGRHLRGKEDFGGALSAFEEAVRLDPAHAPSWTGLAEITVLAAHMGMIPPRAACTAARKALATAKDLQEESAEGLHVEAFAAFLERRWDAMESAWRRAIEIQPDHVLALGSFAISLCARQRLDEALPLFERAREADPLASFPYTLAGWGLLLSGRPEEALRHIEDALTFEKEDASAIGASCMANVAMGRLDEGIAAGERGVAVAHRAPFFLGVLGWALAAAGRDGEARTVLEELRARPATSPTAVSQAWLLGALGEIDDAFDVLARAEEEHQGLLSYTGLPGFDSLRSDPRFGALLDRLGLPSAS